MDSTVAAYTAGIVDGEGCISMEKRKFTLRLYVSNTNLNLLIWIREHWGGHIKPNHRRAKPNHRAGFNLFLNSKETLFLLETVLPFLIVKKEEALLVLSIKYIIRDRNRRNEGQNIRHRAARQKVYEELKLLKKSQFEIPDKVQSDQSVLKFPSEEIA